MLRQRSRPYPSLFLPLSSSLPVLNLLIECRYLFSNTIAPPVVGAAIDTYDILMKSTALRDRLADNTEVWSVEAERGGKQEVLEKGQEREEEERVEKGGNCKT
jgi:hypothetical protein